MTMHVTTRLQQLSPSKSLRFRRVWVLSTVWALLVTLGGIAVYFYGNPNLPDYLPEDIQTSYEPETVYSYSIDFNSSGREIIASSSLAPSAGAGLPSSETGGLKDSELRYRARLLLFANREGKGSGYRVHARLQFQRLHFAVNGESQKFEERELPFLFHVSNGGRISKYYIPQDKFESHAFLVRDLIALVELPFPSDRLSSWKAEENSFLRRWPALFRLKDLSKEEAIFVKTYDKSRMSDKIQITGEGHFRYSREKKHLVSIEGKRTIGEELMDGRRTEGRLDYAIRLESLKRLERSDLSYFPSPQNPMKSGPRFVADSPTGDEQLKLMEMRSFVSILEGSKKEEVRNELQSLDPSAPDQSNTKLYQKLDALMKIDPLSARMFGPMLKDLDYSDKRLVLLMQAMISASTPEAQTAIREAVMASDENPQKAGRMLTELSFVKTPSKESEHFFRELIRSAPPETARRAEYALANVAHFVKDVDHARAVAIANEQSVQLLSADKASDRSALLHHITTLGNIGLTEQIDTLMPYLKSQDGEIRDSAYQALRFVDSDRARALLLLGLEDADDRVREGSSYALGFTPGTDATVRAYEDRLKVERNETVLKQMLTHLTAMTDRSAEARKILRDFLTNCGKPSICNYASSMQSAR